MVTVGTVVFVGTNRAGRFIEIEDCDSLPPFRDDSDLHGAIEIAINGVDVLDRGLADDVITTWAHVATLVNDYAHGRRAVVPLPDQPIVISLKPLPRAQVLVAVESPAWRRVATADAEDLIFTLRFAGNQFFDKLEELTGRYWPQVRALLNAGSEFQQP